ncbi:MAG: hypothetical protein C0616_00145 [Desulfuromonas sp.]|nr:MAG: hypothetical protein C0616_00145 [Desulfuromonas sp.]
MLSRRTSTTNASGFTMVETIMVMAILSIVMMAIMSLYIPAVRSSSVQTELSETQANLRLAMDRMTRDLLSAGFLVRPEYAAGGAAGAILWQGDVASEDTDDLTIRTRLIGDSFGRVVDNDGAGKFALSNQDMASAFTVNSTVRIFQPMSAVEAEGIGVDYDEDDPTTYDDYLHTVTAIDDSGTGTVNGTTYPAILTLNPAPTGTFNQSVIVKIRDNAQPPMQTIRYRVNNGALERIVNGVTQLLAPGVESVLFDYERSATGAVKKIDITLTGEPVGREGGGIESEDKERQLQTSVTLRNVY